MTPDYRDHLLDVPGLHPNARRKFKALIAAIREKGYPIVVWETLRTWAQQRQLYAQGRTDAELLKVGYTAKEIIAARGAGYTAGKGKVTWIRVPKYHGTGRAMDCVWLINGKITWDAPADWWALYGRAARAYGLAWGGDWKAKDLAHVQLEGK